MRVELALLVDDTYTNPMIVAGLVGNGADIENAMGSVAVPLSKFLMAATQFWATGDQAADGRIGRDADGAWDSALRNAFIDRIADELTEVIDTINSWKYPQEEATQ